MKNVDTQVIALDNATALALAKEVADAKARGWLQADLKRFFHARSITLDVYKAAVKGGPVPQDIHGTLTALSITGLPEQPHTADPAAIRQHIEWLIDPARGQYDDALIELAFDGPGRGPTAARLFSFDELDEAVGFAATQNGKRSNIYIGAALRLPDARRDHRASSEDFYVATAVPMDIDRDYDATRAKMAAICDDGLVITTGMTPERRSQHWARLIEPCDNDLEFGAAFKALVEHTGADMAVKDSARIMRLGGTVSYPNDRKVTLGYCTELASVTLNDTARPVSLAALSELSPGDPAGPAGDYSARPKSDGIERDNRFGLKVVNGREEFFRNILLRELAQYQTDTGSDPTEAELFDAAYARFVAEADNSDERWTSLHGQAELKKRTVNTIRRLRVGRLSKVGLYSIDTEAGRDVAEQVAANRAATRRPATQAEPEVDDDPGPFPASSFSGEPPTRRWVVDRWIIEGAVNSLYGDGGVGKTLLAQQLACSVALGVPWAGIPTAQGSVLAVLCEDECDELHRRHNDIKAAMGYAVGNPFSDVMLWPRTGRNNIMLGWGADGNPVEGVFVERLKEQVNAIRPSLLILDTLADFYAANEIVRAQVNFFVKVVLGGLIRDAKRDGWALTVLLLGHPSDSSKATGKGYSGSTAWNAAVRSRMYLSKPEEGASEERILTRGKANYASSGDDTAIRLFFANGVLHAQNDADDGDTMLWAAKRDVVDMVDKAWRMSTPYSAQKGHKRDIYILLPQAMAKAGFGPEITRQAVRECIEDGEISVSASNGKRGYKGASSAK